MSKSRLQDFELPDDALGRISAGDAYSRSEARSGSGSESRLGARSTAPQDLYPIASRGEHSGLAQNSQEFADTRPIGVEDSGNSELPSGFHVRIAAPRVNVAESEPIIAPIMRRGRPSGDGPQPKRVLVVDDDITTRLYLRSRLMLRGHLQLLEAANGAQAMEFLITQRFDAVLLDVDMGEQNGFEVCRAIRSHVRSIRGKQPRIYIITSRSGVLDKMRAKMAGADAFLSKPPHPGELAELLAQL